jgi:preprotein translocase subunit SecA
VTRKEAYSADITYGTNNEFGFDYLRDNMAPSAEKMVQNRGEMASVACLNYAIIDEVDSVLIDEARTPLIISAPAEESAKMYQQFARIVPQLVENQDYNIDEKMRAVALTDDGIHRVEKILGLGNIYNEGGVQLVHHLEQALRANTLFKCDRDYIVKNGEVIIIDEFTGRLMYGRRYSEGLHQAIEAKENVEVKKESLTLATVTLQNYFRLYKKLAGMTGTAITEAEEFYKIYKLEVVAIPTNKAMARGDFSDKIFASEAGKFKAVIEKVRELHAVGQPVLIGTISIEKNELLSRLLENAGVPHQVLNAKNHEKEAQIIAQAGKLGAVTLATNMAGRGVDIILGGEPAGEEHDKVVALGGLFILGTERHESRRIDNQLRGRAGRQGDPGSSQFFISLDDDLMRIFGSDRIKNMMRSWGVPEDVPIENRLVSRAIESAQHRVEGHNFDIRKHLVEYDDVLNKQREAIYKRRREVLAASDKEPAEMKKMILEMVSDELNQIVSFHTASEDQSIWNLKEIAEVANAIFNVDAKKLEEDLRGAEKLAGDKQQDAFARTEIINYLEKLADEQYDLLEQEVSKAGEGQMRQIEKELLVRAIDNLWVEHLSAIDILRTGIGLRGYGQRDPLVEYKREAYDMYIQLLNLINKQVVYTIYKIGPGVRLAKSVVENNQQKEGRDVVGAASAKHSDKVGRNDPCPCGSGLKYKKCCGV